MEEDTEKKVRVEELAEKIKSLFVFSATLIPYKDLLKETADSLGERESMVDSAAVIISAFGHDYFSAHDRVKAKKERAEALYTFIDVLDKTEGMLREIDEGKVREREGEDWVRRLIG